MLWFVALVPISLIGVWLAARHWYGWAISAASEFVWAAYSVAIHSPSLLVMSAVWLALHCRNTWRTYRDAHPRRQAWVWRDNAVLMPYDRQIIEDMNRQIWGEPSSE